MGIVSSLRSMDSVLMPISGIVKKFECPVCGDRIKAFQPFGKLPRPNAQCPVCKSLERHRLVWLYFREKTNLFEDSLKMLHIAPEPCLSRHLRNLPNVDYVIADLDPCSAMIEMDITNIPFPDNEFDVIYASHVLEHIQDDMKAMRELHRVLAPHGWAILQVPILAEKTFEDPTVKSPENRERLFGQNDHVRIYGLDYKDRLNKAGFRVRVDPFARSLGLEKCRRCGLMENEDIYYCLK
ncbi:MAG: class I SAM-dependent methyltransferase [Thermodesulfobacteriota bacterium]|nr:class I SAM-dependent methyltransferase [Thermodesulfobacteriota bacterium]